MKAILILATVGLLAACGPSTNTEYLKERETVQYAVRKEHFKNCMELAATMPRQSDDDVADIVKACDNHSYYMSNYAQDKAK